MPGMTTQVMARKEQRKLARKKRKRHEKHVAVSIQEEIPNDTIETDDRSTLPSSKRQRSASFDDDDDKPFKKDKKKSSKSTRDDPYHHLSPGLADALRRDDDEIADLEQKLGLGSRRKKSKDKLNKEYAKLEGYGDDFGDFLDDLDDMVKRVTTTTSASGDTHGSEGVSDSGNHRVDDFSSDEEAAKEVKKKKRSKKKDRDQYADIDDSTASLLRRDDEEIADLEKKLGMSKKREKDKLYKEYSAEGYGDDFGDFLDGLDDMVMRLKNSDAAYERRRPLNSDESENTESSEDEELVPMKGPHDDDMDEDDSVLEELERMQEEERKAQQKQQSDSEEEDDEGDNGDNRSVSSGSESSSAESGDEDGSEEEEPDHDVADTYTPSSGQDIYGNVVDADANAGAKPSKYVPPHLRKKQQAEEDEGDREKRRMVARSLNNALNRLSEDTMISVAQQVAALYPANPSQLVHDQLWANACGACIELPMLMTGLIPVYTACITGVHLQTGDTVQVGEVVLEKVVTDLWKRLDAWRSDTSEGDEAGHDKEIKGKHICNLMLVLGYLYNYNVVHCSFMYDVIRHLIQNFSEVDIECLLILLSHCGRSLRSDDPLALKEIVLLVQKKQAQDSKLASSSRAEYMISAIMDLKNNRRKKQDTVFSEKAAKLRKTLGQIKSSAARSGVSKTSSEASLRITLEDILNAETKGRWWKVGASWVGNQYRFSEGSEDRSDNNGSTSELAAENEADAHLLKLADKLRMNTDRKRSIFCIIMGGSDCEDTFEKLCRSSMLQNRSERDAVRVLLECCGHEKSYNKFYGHLAARICEYQPQSRFSLQLAFWDAFKQFDSMGVRKAANLAKLLFHLVVTHQTLKLLPVVKTIDTSDEDLGETGLIFLTLLFSSILEHFDDPMQVKALFARHERRRGDDFDSDDEEAEKHREQDEGVRAGLLVFFVETLKSSPKNTKGSRFRKNFKAVVTELDADGFENMF